MTDHSRDLPDHSHGDLARWHERTPLSEIHYHLQVTHGVSRAEEAYTTHARLHARGSRAIQADEPVRQYSSTPADRVAAVVAAADGYHWEYLPEHLRQEYRDRVRQEPGPATASAALRITVQMLAVADEVVAEIAALRGIPVGDLSRPLQTQLHRLARWLDEHPDVDREAWAYAHETHVTPPASEAANVDGLRARLGTVRGGRDDVDMTEET